MGPSAPRQPLAARALIRALPLLLAALPPLLAPNAGSAPGAPLLTAPQLAGDGYDRLRAARAAALSRATATAPDVPAAPADVDHGFDILAYDLFLRTDLTTETIAGISTITLAATSAPLTTVGLHLAPELAVDTLRVAGIGVTPTRSADSLQILLPAPLAPGDSTSLQITYSGAPAAGLYFRTPGGAPYIYTYNAPYDARHWFPCWDLPGDKARSRITVRAREDLHVYANGRLVGVTPPMEGYRTWTWQEDHAIATYLISVEIAATATLRDSVTIAVPGADSLRIPLHHEVFPEDSLAALVDFANVGEMLRFYSAETETPYPFDKYGYGEVPNLNGAMEDQTCVTIGSPMITGARTYEDVIAHEASHMWFGDLVTPDDFRSVWLNEGFASYWDILFTNHLYGPDAFRDRLLEYRRRRSTIWETTPIYAPPLSLIYSSIEYEKAALVLHMLRWVMGDTRFHQAIVAHINGHRFDHASSASFQADCEAAYNNTDLTWFFDEWIYRAGIPAYQWSWRTPGDGRLLLQVDQPSEPRFAMPLPFRVYGPFGTLELRAEIPAEPSATLEFELPAATADSLAFDPDLWILADASETPWTGISAETPAAPPGPATAQLGAPAPNPFNPRLQIPFDLTAPAPIRLTVHDLRGALVTTLADAPLPAGHHQFTWLGRDRAGRPCASGVYILRLQTPHSSSERRVLLLR